MPTENPKISAYVPQVVYDRFKQYQEERQLSMSQAAIEILAHYFGLHLEEPVKEFTSGLPSRILQVEQSIEELKMLYIQLASKVDQVKTTSEPPDEKSLDDLNSQIPLNSEPLSELKSDLPEISIDEPDSEPEGRTLTDNNESNPNSEPLSKPQSVLPEKENLEVPFQLNLVDSTSNSLSSSLKELSLSATKLGKRLSIDRTTLGSRKKKESVEEFANMTSQKDPDGIKWVYSEELKSYIPYGDLSQEQMESLKSWKSQHSTK